MRFSCMLHQHFREWKTLSFKMSTAISGVFTPTTLHSATSISSPSSFSLAPSNRICNAHLLKKSISSLSLESGRSCSSRWAERKSCLKVYMSSAVGAHTSISDALFADYKPTSAFLFPGQKLTANKEEIESPREGIHAFLALVYGHHDFSLLAFIHNFCHFFYSIK